jgi:hypothetical protein
MSRPKLPSVIYIESIDPGVKATDVMTALKERLEEDGHRVAITLYECEDLDPIFIQMSKTLHAREHDYTQERATRMVQTAFQRNCYRAAHLNELFFEEKYDIILASRTYMRDLFVNTALVAEDLPQSMKFLDVTRTRLIQYGRTAERSFNASFYELHDLLEPDIQFGRYMPNHDENMAKLRELYDGLTDVERDNVLHEYIGWRTTALGWVLWRIYDNEILIWGSDQFDNALLLQCPVFDRYVITPPLEVPPPEMYPYFDFIKNPRLGRDMQRVMENRWFNMVLTENVRWIHDHWNSINDMELVRSCVRYNIIDSPNTVEEGRRPISEMVDEIYDLMRIGAVQPPMASQKEVET